MSTSIICNNIKDMSFISCIDNFFLINMKNNFGISKVGIDLLFDIRETVNSMK